MSINAILNSPIDLVWDAWTKPDHITEWWGPNGFTNVIHKMDLVKGGEWKLTMRGPDGQTYPNRSVFEEIVFQKKIVFQHFNPNFLSTIIFEPKNEQTEMTWTSLFESTELFDTVVNVFKADQGMVENVEKLEKHLINV